MFFSYDFIQLKSHHKYSNPIYKVVLNKSINLQFGLVSFNPKDNQSSSQKYPNQTDWGRPAPESTARTGRPWTRPCWRRAGLGHSGRSPWVRDVAGPRHSGCPQARIPVRMPGRSQSPLWGPTDWAHREGTRPHSNLRNLGLACDCLGWLLGDRAGSRTLFDERRWETLAQAGTRPDSPGRWTGWWTEANSEAGSLVETAGWESEGWEDPNGGRVDWEMECGNGPWRVWEPLWMVSCSWNSARVDFETTPVEQNGLFS